MVKLKRVYDPAARDDGERVLVERLWPRGMKKEAAALAEWLRDIAPSPELRQWYGHEPAKWPEFKRRYQQELRAPERHRLLQDLAARARHGTVTLVFAARDAEHNGAVVVHAAVQHLLHRPARRA